TNLPGSVVIACVTTPASSSNHGASTARHRLHATTQPRLAYDRDGVDTSAIAIIAAIPGATRNGENNRATVATATRPPIRMAFGVWPAVDATHQHIAALSKSTTPSRTIYGDGAIR